MEHNYFSLDNGNGIVHFVINQRDNNLDKIDNLDEIPQVSAVFAVCGRVNGMPANPRFVGESDNLQLTIRGFFSKEYPAPDNNQCFKNFMLSIKTKVLVFIPLSNEHDNRKKVKEDWVNRFNPKCNEVMNEIH